MADRRLAQGQQPANRVDPDAEGIPQNQPPVSSGRVTVDLTREEAQGLADFLAHGAMDASMPVENRIRDEVAARLRAALAAARSVGEGAADE